MNDEDDNTSGDDDRGDGGTQLGPSEKIAGEGSDMGFGLGLLLPARAVGNG
jgi:hypothetical protein